MPTHLPPFVRAARLADVQAAIDATQGYRWLASKWGMSRAGAFGWCFDNIRADDRKKLSEGGRSHCYRNPHLNTAKRLEMIALCTDHGWNQHEMAQAIGITDGALSTWLSTHAPFGLVEALSDFREEDTTPRSAAA